MVIFAVSLALFAAPSLIRWSSGMQGIIGTPTYMHERIAQDILDGKFNWYDNLSFEGRFYSYPPGMVFMLSALGYITGVEIASVLLLAIFGAAGIVLFYLISKNHVSQKNLCILLLITTPGLIKLYAHLSTRAPGITLGLAAIYLCYKKKHAMAGLLLGVSYLIHPEPPIIFSLIILVWFILEKQNLKGFGKVFFIGAIIGALWYGPFIAQHGFIEYNSLHQDYRNRGYSLETSGPTNFLWEIKGMALDNGGYLSIPILLMSILGLLFVKNSPAKIWFLIIMILCIAAARFLEYLPFFAALLVTGLLDRIKGKKKYSMIISLIILYAVIIAVLRIDTLYQDYPSSGEYEAFTWIRNNVPENETVFSDWQWGHWITGISNRKVYLDGYAEYAPDINQRMDMLKKFYATCELPQNIRYVYMEKWLLDRMNTTCTGNFTIIYNKDGSMVLKK